MKYTVSVFSDVRELPVMECRNFFHSTDFFKVIGKSKGQKPYMVVACDSEGSPAAHLLVILKRRGSLMPPYLFTQGRVYGEGEYCGDAPRETLFRLMLEAVNRTLKRKLCLYIEFSNISTKMFAYSHFRACGYFPIRWMQIHNSLHSMPPADRLSEKAARRIRTAMRSEAEVREIDNDGDMSRLCRLIRSNYRFKIFRYPPDTGLLVEMWRSGFAKMYVCTHKGQVIGGCSVVMSEGNAYLWHYAAKGKSHPMQHPKTMSVWHAMSEAYDKHCPHFYFMDAGLPFRSSKRREFILGFGGKPTSSYRWFRFTVQWMNRILAWFYRE